MQHRDREIDLLDHLSIFRPLALPAIEQLADRLEARTFDARRARRHPGGRGDRFYVIEHGSARVVRNGAISRDLGDGDCFGEIALLRNVPRTASVIAMTTFSSRPRTR